MAKISFTKLGLKSNNEIQTIEFNEQIIEVKQYLSIEKKLEIIGNVLVASHDEENNFSNPIKISIFTFLEIVEKYTNIGFTEKQKEDPAKLYDLFVENNLMNKIIDKIPREEYEFVLNGINTTIDSVYKYRNSLMGILDSVSTDYSNLKLDAIEIQKQLGDPNTLNLVKDIVTKLG